MFPDVEADVALCAYTLPYGSPVEDTRSIQDQLLSAGDTAITKIEEEFGMPIVKGARSTIGGRTWGRMNPGGGHAGRISYELLPRMSALSQPKSLLNAGEQRQEESKA